MISMNDSYLKTSSKYLLIIIILIGVFSITDITAQEEIDNEDKHLASLGQNKIPVLGQHKFMPNTIVLDPFIKTYIRNGAGLGLALTLKHPAVFIRDTAVFSFGGQLIFGTFDIEYHHAVKDWLGMWGKLNILARLGTDTQSILSQGVSAILGFEFGWLINLMKKENTMLSLSLSLKNGGVTLVNVLNFINEIDVTDSSRNSSLVNSIHSLQLGSGLRFAWAVSKLFGIYADAELLYGQSTGDRGENEIFYNFGAVLDFDLSTVSDLPFGVLLGYRQTSLQLSNAISSGNLNTFIFRIGYNIPNDFSVALESSVNKTRVDELDQTLTSLISKVMLRYYFE